jgi:putative type II DNA modification enzyme (methyltransferase)
MAQQSVEPKIANHINQQLSSYHLKYFLQQETVNTEIENALSRAASKSGGDGGNRVDCKLLLQDDLLNYYPVMIEYKGYADKLEKLNSDGHPDNFNKKKNEPNYKNINAYAVNGAVHYANALLEFTSYTDVIAIGITGEVDISGNLKIKIGVYYVGKSNYGVGQKIGEFSDLSFLKPENFSEFIQKVKFLKLTPAEIDKIHKDRENRIEDALTKINERLYNKQENLSALSRIHLVSASIMANLGVAGKVQPLEAKDLTSSTEEDYTDGDIILKKIKSFLKEKGLPKRKQEQILNSLSVTIKDDNLSKPKNGQSLLKEIFIEVVEDLGYFYKVGLDTDFTGKLFNIMFRWLSFAGDDQNDVVLTPRYVAYLMAKLARVNKDSYVWDFATGSGGLLVASMNLMLQDAKSSINSPDELRQKENKIKTEQILGIEVLPEIYMLAVLNMILMGDGSSNILQENSLTNFNGRYGYGKENQNFPADVFLLNPPYSAVGNGMVFVEKALNMMNKGYAAIIIQDSAGSGKARDINRRILQKHTLLASIKMPNDLFVGKSNVQTAIYVFKVGEKHEAKFPVKFIDFQNDGYKRSNRKKAKASSNLKNINHAEERYAELVDLVKYGKSSLHFFSENEYVEDTIALDGDKYGADWNFAQHKKIDAKPTLADFKKTVADYLAWEVSQLLAKQGDAQGK